MSSIAGKQFPTPEKDEEPPARVSPATYWKYFQCGGVSSFILFTFTCLTLEIFFCASDYWLNLWTRAEMAHLKSNSNITNTSTDAVIKETEKNATSLYQEQVTLSGNEWMLDRSICMYVYCILIGGVFILAALRLTQFCKISSEASLKLHNNMFEAVIRAPVQFFNTTPLGKGNLQRHSLIAW